jgi:hypothetical protein
MLDPAGIPQAVLSGQLALDHLATYLPEQEDVVDEATVGAVLRVLRANTTALHDSADAALWRQDDDAHLVLFRAANSLGDTGQVTADRAACTDLAATARDRLGSDHPHALAARSNLARWRARRGARPDHAKNAGQDE